MKLTIVAAVAAAFSFSVQAAEFWQLGESRGAAKTYSPAGVEHHAVTFATNVLSSAPATLELPLPDGVAQFVLTRATARADGALWQGHLAGEPEHLLQLTQHKGMLAGLISLHDATFELVPVDVGQSALVRIDHGLYPACGGAHPAEGEAQSADTRAPEGVDPAFRDRPGDIDVLIVYTSAALTGAGGLAQMEVTAHAAVDNANMSFANSAMDMRFNLVGLREIAYTETGSASPALPWLRDNATAKAWRDELFADMTALFIETDPGGCGIGYLMISLSPTNEKDAVQVTRRNCAVGNLTYAHEHGHNMGMHHNPESAGPPVIAPDAYAHWDNSGATSTEYFRTVLSYNCPSGPSCTRRMYFSNPDIAYLGRPTGIVGARNNARIGNYVSDLVANFRIKTILRHGFD